MKNITLVLFIVSSTLFGQNNVKPKQKWLDREHLLFFWLIPDSTIDSKVCLKTTPLSNLGAYVGPCFRVTLEYKVKKGISFCNEFGWFYAYTKGAIAKFEVKKYINRSKLNVGDYVSAELSYKHQEYNESDTISYFESWNPLILKKYQKDFSVSKNVECFTIKYGFMQVFKFGFVVDLYAGLGIRLKQTKNTLTAFENEHMQGVGDYGIDIRTNEAGNFVYPNIDAGIKIGYSF